MPDFGLQEWLLAWGYPGMFIAALLAATLLPMGSELILLTLLSQGLDAGWLWLLASLGNVLGSIINYGLGRWAAAGRLGQWQQSPGWARATRWFDHYGSWTLLLAWLPVVGDPLTLVAGLAKVRFWWFVLLVTIGKSLRYGLLVGGYMTF
ncbi:YqaA family protein [Oceanobacter mangrovi]|uniref:YqaA family protein n=1 Tax=Oceanobacter mangrovi TaxID=2862510 RepID=UPI001C8DE520|nr:YqaA family protein [Oceanobacter mangrovi]